MNSFSCYIFILILFFSCKNEKKEFPSKEVTSIEIPLGKWDMLTLKNNNDTILFYPLHMDNRYITLKKDSLFDFNGQENISCKINNIYILNDKYYVILEPNCNYADTISFQVLADNLIEWYLYNGISFISTNTPKKYDTIYEYDSLKENTLYTNNLSKKTECLDIWYDIFYLYPFDESPDNIGTYYIQIKKDKESVFATSFGNREIRFNYEIEPYCNNDTMFIAKKNSPEILARITKIGDNYFVQSDLIKVFSEYIIPEKYGYKLEKGFPND